jgi:hypothetical protein
MTFASGQERKTTALSLYSSLARRLRLLSAIVVEPSPNPSLGKEGEERNRQEDVGSRLGIAETYWLAACIAAPPLAIRNMKAVTGMQTTRNSNAANADWALERWFSSR